MINILGIVGSPRKNGNTEKLMNEALRTSEQANADTDMIRLADFDLKPCDGCRVCFRTKNCIIKDDVENIFSKIVESDGIIIGSPVYFYNVNAQTKIFIDRVGYLHIAREKKHFQNKVGGAIAVAGRSGLMNTLSQIMLFFSSARMIIAAPAVRALASTKGDVTKDKRGIETAKQLGDSIVQIAKATNHLRNVD
jgi:multimeric flavodoxin WrbA